MVNKILGMEAHFPYGEEIFDEMTWGRGCVGYGLRLTHHTRQ